MKIKRKIKIKIKNKTKTELRIQAMPWRKKKNDPISARARALNSEIAALETQIRKLDSKLQRESAAPRMRSTTRPHGDRSPHSSDTVTGTTHPASAPAREPIFESLELRDLKGPAVPPTAPELYNELGVRKYDVTSLAARVQQWFRGPAPMNPRLVSYLAAGGIQGLQPLRREKRVARNRLIALAAFLGLVLLGIVFLFARHR